jgi:NAD(P)-dependent dehydrogenase (short-subunit alcohol dehydrogenase family)
MSSLPGIRASIASQAETGSQAPKARPFLSLLSYSPHQNDIRGFDVELANRIAIVTGGTGALGSAVTLDLLAAGARVAVTYVVEEEWTALRARAASSMNNLHAAKVDLTQPTEVEGFVDELTTQRGRIDFLVAIAGGFAPGKSYEADYKTWDHMFNLNFRSLVNCLRAIVPLMIQQNFGRIVTISSGSILHGGGAGIAPYAISKGAVRQLSEILADEVKAYNIHVHCLMPGTMDTPANRRAMPNADFSKWVKTEDVARVIRFLVSDDARAMRSVVVPVLG